MATLPSCAYIDRRGASCPRDGVYKSVRAPRPTYFCEEHRCRTCPPGLEYPNKMHNTVSRCDRCARRTGQNKAVAADADAAALVASMMRYWQVSSSSAPDNMKLGVLWQQLELETPEMVAAIGSLAEERHFTELAWAASAILDERALYY